RLAVGALQARAGRGLPGRARTLVRKRFRLPGLALLEPREILVGMEERPADHRLSQLTGSWRVPRQPRAPDQPEVFARGELLRKPLSFRGAERRGICSRVSALGPRLENFRPPGRAATAAACPLAALGMTDRE